MNANEDCLRFSRELVHDLLLIIVCVAVSWAGVALGSNATDSSTNKLVARRYTYTPRPYPLDERGFSPVDKALAKAYAREEMIKEDADGSLNPYVLKVIS